MPGSVQHTTKKGNKMSEQVNLLDNAGHIVPPDPRMSHPVAASGITLTVTAPGNDYTQTVEQGRSYAITFVATAGKRMLVSISGPTSTASNIEWVFMANQEYVIHIPIGPTTLYFEGDEGTKYAYMRKIAER